MTTISMNVSRLLVQPRSALSASALAVAALLALCALSGCAQPRGPVAKALPPLPAASASGNVSTAPPGANASATLAQGIASAPAAAASASEPALADLKDTSDAHRQPIIIRGNDRVIERQPSAVPHALTGQVASFRFDNAPVGDVVQVMLRDLLKVDYVVHPPLQGTVTLATRAPVSPDRALLLLETALQANGIVMARDSRGVYHVGTPDSLRNVVAAPAVAEPGQPLPPGYGAVIIPLRYLGANEMANILRPIVSPDAILRVDTLRNLLVMRGTRAEAEGWLDLVATFDVDLLRGMSVGVFPLKYTSTDDVAAALRMLSGATGDAAATTAGTPGAPTGMRPAQRAPAPPARTGVAQAAQQAAQAAGLGDNNPLFGAIRVMPIDRLNAIMVVTPRAAYLDEVRYWIEQFDRPNMNSNEPQLFVYKVKNGSADHLAELLNGIYGGGVLTTQQPGRGGNGVAPGLNTVSGANGLNNNGFASNFGNNAFGNNGLNNGLNGGIGGGGIGGGGIGGMNGGIGGMTGMGGIGGVNQNGNQGGATVTTTLLGDSVRVMADHINNTLLIHAAPAEYERIESTLKRLDVQRAQVLIEASIVEVTLGDTLQYGLEWAFNNNHISINGNNNYTGTGMLGTPATASTVNGGSSTGFTWALSNPTGISATLSALADKSLVKVISSPSLLVLDNQTAAIQVGNQQPVSTGTVTSTVSDYTSTSIQYQSTGVMLGVTPSVTAGDLVTMNINQVVSDLGAASSSATPGYPTFMQRQINTAVSVRSGETVVLGGLIKDNVNNENSGIPFLSNLPLIGALFGTHTKSNQRTELLVIITPRVLRSDEDARAVTREMRDRMRGLSTDDLPAISPPNTP